MLCINNLEFIVMRLLLGVIATVIVVTGAVLTILAIWGVQPVSWEIVWKSGVTIAVLCVSVLVVCLFYYIFFKKYSENRRD